MNAAYKSKIRGSFTVQAKTLAKGPRPLVSFDLKYPGEREGQRPSFRRPQASQGQAGGARWSPAGGQHRADRRRSSPNTLGNPRRLRHGTRP
ncbi:hypothetical protein GCM10011415_04630 [Salipiger pallidus]|uniref:Uncharacterized protein n=1 Tax=Salipiger pallidus TaxID=1775170 RepID=A0A8J3EF55_9RHOB|nr:hypothetical protein GCM10011415_04630 [Salipiger pallidus]